MRKIFLGLILMGITSIAFSQQSIVKGKVSDTLEKKSLQFATVTLLHKSDSTLFTFTRTDKSGFFSLPNVKPGKYLLLISYPKFADYADEVEIKEGPETDLGIIPLTLRARLLDAVVIRSTGSIRIKGDTTEFAADSFKVREGATVEELLKVLPGFQVNSKGEVTAQGQRVDKVLVDGEEFFGDDPTMATQNISAKAVDKVQVYDTKTEQQNLTGISSGNEGKTVNIKLKEDAKKGAFGKLHFGTDFQKLIDAKAMYNKFSGKKKFSVYATKSDISTGSLNWEDKQKLGIEEDYEYDEIAGYYYSFNNDEYNDWSLRGLPNSYTAGALYSDKWLEDRNAINLSYRFNRLGTVNEASELKQYLLTSGINYSNRFQNSTGLNQQHSATAKYEWKIDSLTSFKLTSTGLYKTTDVQSLVINEFLDEQRNYKNRGTQGINNSTERKQGDNTLTYKQLFRKANRQLITTIRYGIVSDNNDGIIQSKTDYYDNGSINAVSLDQLKLTDGHSRTMGGKITWSEPLTTKWNLVTEYSYNNNKSSSHRNTFNKDFNGKYAVLDKEFSNNFDLKAESHGGNLVFKYTDKKIRAAVGSGISNVNLELHDLDSSHFKNYNFLNLTPQGSISYTFKPQTRLYLNYRGTTRQPTIDQLQPIRDNTDPNNIYIGNPDLKVGFNHSLNLGYSSYKTLSQTYFSVSAYANIPVNAISYSYFLDLDSGKRRYTPINVNGNRNYGSWAYYFKEGGDKKWGYGFNMDIRGGRNLNYTTELKENILYEQTNITTYYNTDFGISLSNRSEKRTLTIHPTFGYNVSESSLRPESNLKYWNFGGNIYGLVTLPWKLELQSDINFNMRQKIAAFAANPNQINWNASLSKKVIKDKGKIYFIVNDILKQNIGFDRQITSNMISENRYARISRYFLLKFEWTISKMPGQEK